MKVRLTISESDELDGSSSTVTFKDFSTLDSSGKNLRKEGIDVEAYALEQLSCWDRRSDNYFALLDTHYTVEMKELKKRCRKERLSVDDEK